MELVREMILGMERGGFEKQESERESTARASVVTVKSKFSSVEIELDNADISSRPRRANVWPI
jgi:hypothetical protein